MAFKPANSGGGGGNSTGDFENRNLPVPKSGSRKARVSLIIDLGIQNREPFEDPKTKEVKEQKPAHQVAVFADLVSDVVDYGGKIGRQQYRLPLNNVFKGVIEGINFNTVPPTDADGKRIEGKPWGLHPRNKLTVLAKAVDMESITYEGKHKESLDISLLLDQPFMANVEVKETPDKNGKKDKDGNAIVYKNVNYKGPSPVPTVEDDEGNEQPLAVPKLTQKPRCITFDSATVEDVQFIRPSIIRIIKQANNYAGSAMQKAIEAYEAQNAGSDDGDDAGGDDTPAEKPQQAESKPKATKPKAAPKPQPQPAADDDSDIPF